MRISVLAASVLAAAIMALPAGAATDPEGAANAPKQSKAETREQPWRASCTSASRDAAPNCAVNKRVVLAKTGQLLTALTIQVPPKTRKPVMMLQAPLGLYLPPGLSLTVGKDKPLSLPLHTCDNKGCYAGQALSDDLLKKFRNGEKLVLGFQNMNRQDVKVTLSLDGFAKAYDQVK